MASPTRTLPTGTVTFLMTDVETSTRMWQEHPDEMQQAITRHYSILHSIVADRGGAVPEEQGEGDSVVAVFSDAAAAVRAAADIQRRIDHESWPTPEPIRVRIALNSGTARLRDTRNYAGEAIIRTARIRALTAGGQVLVSRSTSELAAEHLDADHTLRSVGEVRLKDLTRRDELFQLIAPGLRDDFDPIVGLDGVPHNLPVQLSSFVGREADLAQVHALVQDVRLLTLTGSGGCGKTRLALQVAADRINQHPDGVWYLELAPLDADDAIVTTLAIALGLSVGPDEAPVDAVVTALQDKRVLLVIDNCEHLIDGAAHAIAGLMARLPRIAVLATSRQPLNLPGETTWRVPSLGCPATDHASPPDALAQFDAVQLFIERAIQARPDFRVDERNAPAVAQICVSVDGIPLAIELAAARVRNLPVERIAEALDDRFRLLAGGSSTLPTRQQTLRASVDWSHELLDETEQRVFRRLSQFAGGFDLDAAETVAGDDETDVHEIHDLLGRLVDRSLVLFDPSIGDGRYRLLETMKQYGDERLREAGEHDDTHQRLARHFAATVRMLAPELITELCPATRAQLARDHENIRLTLEWCDAHDHALLGVTANDLVFYWQMSARFVEGDHWLGRAVDLLVGDVLAARAMWGRAYLAFYAGDFEAASEWADDAEAAGTEVGDDLTVARAIDVRADVTQLADPRASIEPLERALALAERTGDEWTIIDLTQKIGFSYLFVSDQSNTLAWFDRCAHRWQALGNDFFAGWHWAAIAWLAAQNGDPHGVDVSERALHHAVTSGDGQTIAFAMFQLVQNLIADGRADEAHVRSTDVASELRARGVVGLPMAMADGACALGAVAVGSEEHQHRQLLLDASLIGRDEGVGVVELFMLEHVVTAMILTDDERTEGTIARFSDVAATVGNMWWALLADLFTADAALSHGDPERAVDLVAAALERLPAEGYGPSRIAALRLLAWGAAQGGDSARATQLLVMADTVDANHGWTPSRLSLRWRDKVSATIADTSVEATQIVTASIEPGFTVDDAVAFALRGRGRRTRPATGWLSLTPTESSVAECVADGLTNPQIADRLYMSRSTVKTHLSHIFTKLDIASRSELAAMVVEHR